LQCCFSFFNAISWGSYQGFSFELRLLAIVPFLRLIFYFGFVFLVCFSVLFSICICCADFVSGFSSGIVKFIKLFI